MRTISNLEAQKLLTIFPSQVGCICVRILKWTSFMEAARMWTSCLHGFCNVDITSNYHAVVVVVVV